MSMKILFAVAVSIMGCVPNICERGREHVAECLGVTYTSAECDSSATKGCRDESNGCSCGGFDACVNQCYYDTDCKWVMEYIQDGHASGLEKCLTGCYIVGD